MIARNDMSIRAIYCINPIQHNLNILPIQASNILVVSINKIHLRILSVSLTYLKRIPYVSMTFYIALTSQFPPTFFSPRFLLP